MTDVEIIDQWIAQHYSQRRTSVHGVQEGLRIDPVYIHYDHEFEDDTDLDQTANWEQH